jgi:hypothetical protein
MNNLESLIIQHLKTAVPKQEVLLFTRRKLHQWDISQGHVQKDLQESLHINHGDISCPLVSYSSNVFRMEASESTEPADKGDIKMQYSSG